MSDRDDRVGEALRDLEVPDHGPDFHAGLMARLESEAAIHPRSSRRPHWKGPYMLTALVAAVTLVVLGTTSILVGGGKGTPGTEPRLITASAVRSRVAGALASLRTIKGEIVVECAQPLCETSGSQGRTTKRWSFVTTAAGDERVTSMGVIDDMAFSAATRTEREISAFEGGRRQGSETTNVAAGPPDSGGRSPLRRELGSVVRAFVADTSDVPVVDTVEDGRPAWRLVAPVVPNKLAGPGRSGDQLEVVVDRQSGFPLRVTESLKGKFLHEVRLSNLVPDAVVDPSVFVLGFPAGTPVFHQDGRFRRVTLDQVAAIVGYRPILPKDLPNGFKMAEITAAAKGAPTGTEGMNPPASGVVSVAYRRGFDRIVVSSRLTGNIAGCAGDGSGSSACWADPVASGEGIVDTPEPFVVGAGALAGTHAQLVVSPRGIPHVWTIGDRLVVTIAGDASGADLRRIAESFAS